MVLEKSPRHGRGLFFIRPSEKGYREEADIGNSFLLVIFAEKRRGAISQRRLADPAE
jgi:hypothetical protein